LQNDLRPNDGSSRRIQYGAADRARTVSGLTQKGNAGKRKERNQQH